MQIELTPAARRRLLARWYGSQFGSEELREFQVDLGGDGDGRELQLRWLGFLLDLLVAYAADRSAVYRDLYLGERQRCFDPSTPRSARPAYFAAVLPEDVAALAESVGASQRDEVERMCRELHAPLLEDDALSEVSILFVGDCLMTEIGTFLTAPAGERGIRLDVRHTYFDASVAGPGGGEISASILAPLEAGLDFVALSFFTYEGLPHYRALAHAALSGAAELDLDAALEGVAHVLTAFLRAVRERSNATILLHDVSGVPGLAPALEAEGSGPAAAFLDRLNERIDEIARQHGNVLRIGERSVAEREGWGRCSEHLIESERFQDPLTHPLRLAPLLSALYLPIVEAFVKLRRAKVLLVDFDDTLWEGVMAEGPVVQHGARQQLLRALERAGLLLVAVSKNDPHAIRWDELLLERSEFVLELIGWEPKVHSIQRAAEALDLGLDTFVFVDDSPEERGLVELHLPEVVRLDSTLPGTWEALTHLLQFPNTASTDRAGRTAVYRAQGERSSHLAGGGDPAQLLRSLEIEVTASVAREADLDRVEELLQRTNQFNCTPERPRKAALRALLADPAARVRVYHLRDRFGDMGLVGAVIAQAREEGEVVFTSVAMSCRAMGHGLEPCMIACAIEDFPGRRCVGVFVPTDRNGPAAALYPGLGFRPEGEQRWIHDPEAPVPAIPDWLRLERGDPHGAPGPGRAPGG